MMRGLRLPDLVIYLRPENLSTTIQRAEFGQERYDSSLIQRTVLQNFDYIFNDSDSERNVLTISSEETIDKITAKIVQKFRDMGMI